MSGHGEKRSRQEDAALSALLSSPTIEAAAEQTGVSTATLRRWLADPSFKTRYRAARLAIVEHAVAGLQQAASSAVAVLVTIAEDTSAQPAARVSAAKIILDQTFRGVEVLDLADDIAMLKRQLAEDRAAAGDRPA